MVYGLGDDQGEATDLLQKAKKEIRLLNTLVRAAQKYRLWKLSQPESYIPSSESALWAVLDAIEGNE